MKKILVILIILVLAGGAVWYWAREKDIPVVETITDILPFGSGESSTQSPASNTQSPNNNQVNSYGPESADGKLFRISDTPVAGFVVLKDKVRYVDRATGHI